MQTDAKWHHPGDLLYSLKLWRFRLANPPITGRGGMIAYVMLIHTQVHGHDMSCIAPLPQTSSKITSFRYVSGAEEK
eukprot:scaffold333330_cov16-Prasinocladus_malaysianus.AAC.1